jgi:hypothetical protein
MGGAVTSAAETKTPPRPYLAMGPSCPPVEGAREMTKPKSEMRLPQGLPAYVTRETGAALLQISAGTWDDWVRERILPAPAPGFPETCKRWRWRDVDARLAGRALDGQEPAEAETAPHVDVGAERAQFLRDGASPRRRRPRLAH